MREPDWQDNFEEMPEDCPDCGRELRFNDKDEQYCNYIYCYGDLRDMNVEGVDDE